MRSFDHKCQPLNTLSHALIPFHPDRSLYVPQTPGHPVRLRFCTIARHTSKVCVFLVERSLVPYEPSSRTATGWCRSERVLQWKPGFRGGGEAYRTSGEQVLPCLEREDSCSERGHMAIIRRFGKDNRVEQDMDMYHVNTIVKFITQVLTRDLSSILNRLLTFGYRASKIDSTNAR
jgi:hypothetical protein